LYTNIADIPFLGKFQTFRQFCWRIDNNTIVFDTTFCTHKSIPYRLFFTLTVLHRFLHLPVAEGKAVFEKPLITCLAVSARRPLP